MPGKVHPISRKKICEVNFYLILIIIVFFFNRALRNRIIECFERASNNNISEAERSRLLTFLVVGGGPTSIEFASELHDFLTVDVSRWYPEHINRTSVIVVEAGKHLLGICTFKDFAKKFVKPNSNSIFYYL